jgi:hypothetical protein
MALVAVAAQAQSIASLDPALHPTDKDLSVKSRVDRIAAPGNGADRRAFGRCFLVG